MVLGAYSMTCGDDSSGSDPSFSSCVEVRQAYDHGILGLHERIRVRMDGKLTDTTCGRVLFYEIVPKELPFSVVNRAMNKKQLDDLLDRSFRTAGLESTVLLADEVKRLGFEQATRLGLSICVQDIPHRIDHARMEDNARNSTREPHAGDTIDLVVDSGALGGRPKAPNLHEGRTPAEYFRRSQASRRSLTVTALKTANSGYLTRRLVDTVGHVVVTELDCGTAHGTSVQSLIEAGENVLPLSERILGRTVANDIPDRNTGVVLLMRGRLLDEDDVARLGENGVERV
jgi:DNA-directed RNA polymerase subunit beta'